MKRLSIKDIAQKAGVATSTVSFVLNGKAKMMRISDSVAQKITAVAKEEGYSPNNIAVSLRTGRSKTLALIVEDISNPFFAALAKTIEEEANKFGYRIVYCSTENDSKKGNDLVTMLLHNQVDGFIITPLPGMEKRMEKLRQLEKPLVFMDRYLPGVDVPYVLLDNKDGVTKGMKYLLKKGYKRIGFVTVDLEQVQMKQRKEAYEKIQKENGNPKLILNIPFAYRREQALEKINEFIKTNDLDAVFFATNYLGILGLECIAKLKLVIPKDLAVICFDDHDIFKLFPPGITTIRQPIEEIAQTTVELLMEQLHSKKPIKRYEQLKAELVIRGSA